MNFSGVSLNARLQCKMIMHTYSVKNHVCIKQCCGSCPLQKYPTVCGFVIPLTAAVQCDLWKHILDQEAQGLKKLNPFADISECSDLLCCKLLSLVSYRKLGKEKSQHFLEIDTSDILRKTIQNT